MYDHDLPAFYVATLFLALGIADGVYESDPSMEWVLNPAILEGREARRLKVKPEWSVR
jgi:hypothetical protein